MKKKEKVRKALLLAARNVFAEKGFTNTTMENIAKEAGKAKSTLYYYYENKEAIFESVIGYESELLKNKLLHIINDPKRSNKEKLKDYILTRWQSFEEIADLFNTMRDEFLYNKEFVEKHRKQYDELEIKFITKILKSGIENNEFQIPLESLEIFASTFVLIMKSLEIPFFVENNYQAIANHLENFIDILFYGIEKK